MPGITELILLLIILVIIFGAKTLPRLGESLGRAVGNFKRSQKAGEAKSLPAGENDDAGRGE